MGKPPIIDEFPLKHPFIGDFPASHVWLPEIKFRANVSQHLNWKPLSILTWAMAQLPCLLMISSKVILAILVIIIIHKKKLINQPLFSTLVFVDISRFDRHWGFLPSTIHQSICAWLWWRPSSRLLSVLHHPPGFLDFYAWISGGATGSWISLISLIFLEPCLIHRNIFW